MATFPDIGYAWIDQLYPEDPTGNEGAPQPIFPMPAPMQMETPPLASHIIDVVPAEAVVEEKRHRVIMKTFLCHVEGCGKGYSAKHDLKMHLAQKHDPQEYSGNPEFKDKKTKEGKPWPCPHEDCPSGYEKRHDLNKHLLGKHAKKPGLSESERAEKLSKQFSCSWPDCKFGFDERWAINKHVDRKHGGKAFEPKETEEKKSLKIVIDKTHKARLGDST